MLSLKDATPVPARVVTTPAGVTDLTRWALVSATSTLREVSSKAKPLGEKKAPLASVQALPASVDVTPAVVITRNRQLPVSATYTKPAVETVVEEGV